MLNKTQVETLFEQEAILIGFENAVPLNRVVELFGNTAAEFGHTYKSTKLCASGIFGVGDFQLEYLTHLGFQQAASYANVEEIRDKISNGK